jgi:hypothetical protein
MEWLGASSEYLAGSLPPITYYSDLSIVALLGGGLWNGYGGWDRWSLGIAGDPALLPGDLWSAGIMAFSVDSSSFLAGTDPTWQGTGTLTRLSESEPMAFTIIAHESLGRLEFDAVAVPTPVAGEGLPFALVLLAGMVWMKWRGTAARA